MRTIFIQLQNFGCDASIKTVSREGRYECAERIHQFPEIVCVTAGEVQITVDGKTEIATAGDLAVIAPFRTHAFRTPEYAKLWIGVISNNFLSPFAHSINGERAVFTPSKSLFEYVVNHLPVGLDSPTAIKDGEGLFYTVTALTHAVLEEYARLVPRAELDVDRRALAKTLTYVSEHYLEPLSLEAVSEAVGYSPTYISHCISAIPNMNFRKLVNSLRIDYAKELMSLHNMKSSEVAAASGFSCERTFRRAFIELYGITPSEYSAGAGTID